MDLVIYFSHKGETIADNEIVYTEGNTKKLAEIISWQLKSDIFRLEPIIDYPETYKETNDRAREESMSSIDVFARAYPDLTKYDRIFLGFPIWYKSFPAIIRTFIIKKLLVENPKAIIYPFCTNEEYAFGYAEIQLLSMSLKCKDGLAIKGKEILDSPDAVSEKVSEWLKR